MTGELAEAVALHPEGVDRNSKVEAKAEAVIGSPSTRRAWIEIASPSASSSQPSVALHPEGVDRNDYEPDCGYDVIIVALHPEGVDRNLPICS